jgi:hypothetical protein
MLVAMLERRPAIELLTEGTHEPDMASPFQNSVVWIVLACLRCAGLWGLLSCQSYCRWVGRFCCEGVGE